MTVNSITNKARRILEDTLTPYRWSDDEIRDHLNDGILSLNRVRPETRYVDSRLVDRIELPDGNDETILIEDNFEAALVFYVVYRCYLNDDSDTVNSQLAEMYLSKFNTNSQF